MKISVPLTVLLGLSGAALAHAQASPPDPWGDAAVTREQSQGKAGQLFDRLDTDHDGSLGTAEAQAASLDAGPGAGRAIGGMMRRADANGDGKLAKAEFLANQQQRFDRQDADHDGKLTKAERDSARAAMMERMQRRSGGGGGFGPPAGGADGQ